MFTAELLEEARKFMHHMLTKVVEYGGSDLFITADFPPSIKHQGLMKPFGQQELTLEKTKLFAYALIDYRNENSAGHIITVEDPVEYVHKHKKSMITHREVGVDSHSWHNALK